MESPKLEFIPVENIGEAYTLAHKLIPLATKPPQRDVLDLPTKTEEWVKQAYQRDREKGTKLWDAIPAGEQKEITSDVAFKSVFVDTRVKAESAFRSGQLLYGQPTLGSLTEQRWRRALGSCRSCLLHWKGGCKEENVKQIHEKRLEVVETLPDPWNLLQARGKELPDSGSQFCGGCYDTYGLFGLTLQHAGTGRWVRQ